MGGWLRPVTSTPRLQVSRYSGIVELKCGISSVYTQRSNVCFFINVVGLWKSFNNPVFFRNTDLACFVARLIFLTLLYDFPFYFWIGVQFFVPDEA